MRPRTSVTTTAHVLACSFARHSALILFLLCRAQVTFVAALWKPAGKGEPFLAAIQALRKPDHDETKFSFDLSLSAYPRPPRTCVSRASAVGPIPEIDAREAWTRPTLRKVRSPVLVADRVSIDIFNTAKLDVRHTSGPTRCPSQSLPLSYTCSGGRDGF